ncbi:hypothetical protein GQF42_41040 [Streptomyces broussonetiae]|uniref:Uncharacterized protein n=1 Tax=Streptomyces broussonetiae TaxID=2686304 RepID=A0A6I6NLJ2_9ACTN|nr:hypothetical protein [Streptomyces broussonetiae]QHA08797.1 hypothetical protein GQF42_41040 [Streptomyces broussonetiae]
MNGQLGGGRETAFLIITASAAVLAVLRPDLYAGLAHRAASAFARLIG